VDHETSIEPALASTPPQSEGDGGGAVGLPESFQRTATLSPLEDTRLIERAIRLGWPVPAEHREAMIKRQIEIAKDPNSKPRAAQAAFRSIIAANAQNLEVERLNQQAELAAIDRSIKAGANPAAVDVDVSVNVGVGIKIIKGVDEDAL